MVHPRSFHLAMTSNESWLSAGTAAGSTLICECLFLSTRQASQHHSLKALVYPKPCSKTKLKRTLSCTVSANGQAGEPTLQMVDAKCRISASFANVKSAARAAAWKRQNWSAQSSKHQVSVRDLPSLLLCNTFKSIHDIQKHYTRFDVILF